MKEYLGDLVRAAETPAQAQRMARDYLQARVLACLQGAGAMIPLAFHGGTALRFLYAAPRYSEDLDFALEGDRANYDFRGYLRAIEGELSAEAYALRVRFSDRRVVNSAFVHFDGLPYELGLSAQRNEALSVKIEVDTRPPAGAVLATTLVRRHVTLRLQHHDRASLLSGKLHAILQRPYAKGRDVWDLLWYLSDPDWPAPNLPLLNNALRQTGWAGPHLTEQNWRDLVRKRLQALVWSQVVADVQPLLDPTAGLGLFTLENVMSVLGK